MAEYEINHPTTPEGTTDDFAILSLSDASAVLSDK